MLEKGVNILHQYEKSAKKGGQKSTILKNIGVKILQVWKWGSKFYMLKNRGQNSTMLEKRGVNILHLTPKVEVKILHRLKKGGQKGRAYPLPTGVGSLVASRVLYRWSSFCFFYGQFACGLISAGTTSTAAMNLIDDTSHYLYDKTTRLILRGPRTFITRPLFDR